MTAWKSVLNHYVRDLNQLEVEPSIDFLRAYVKDEAFLQALSERIKRLTNDPGQHQRRVQRCETRGQLIDVNERDHQVAARLRLLKKWTYDSGIQREQVEIERITIIFRRVGWVISKIEAEPAEKQRSSLIPLDAGSSKQSFPYINREILSRSNDYVRSIQYNRKLAVQYAEKWWNSANPKYEHFHVDCTNFVSQCIFAGGIPMNYTGRRETGWWYEGYVNNRERWSLSWAVAHSLQIYLLSSRTGLRAEKVESPRKLALGDIISYDWDGDTRYQHTAIVTAFDSAGEPLVNAHTNDSRHRFWDYRDSYAWSERTQYTFLHIPDAL